MLFIKRGSPNLQACLFTEQVPSPTVCVHAKSLHSRLSAILWIVARQAPLPMGFSRQEYWSGLLCRPPGDLLDPGTEQVSSALAGRFLTTSATWKAPALQPACWIRSSERRNICIVNKTPRWFWGSPESQNHCTCLSVNSGYYWHMGQLVIFIFFSLYFPQLTCLEIKERYDLNV